jgi:hypothetical protein
MESEKQRLITNLLFLVQERGRFYTHFSFRNTLKRFAPGGAPDCAVAGLEIASSGLGYQQNSR